MLDTPANVPATVTVVYPRADDEVLGTSVYAVSVTLASLSLAEYGDEVGRVGNHLVHSAAVANFTGGGTPVNDAELQTLAEQVATDFYLWRLASVNAKYRGLLPWTCDGMHDVEYLHGATIATSVFVSRWEPDFANLKHAGAYGSSDVPVTGGGAGGITHVNGNTGPMVRVGLGRSGTGPNLGATAAAWASTVAYQIGDVVSLSGDNYHCILAHTNHTPPNATYWTVTTEDLIVANMPDASDVNRGQVNLLSAQQFGGDLKYIYGAFGAGKFRICQSNPVGAGGALVNVDSWDWTGISPTSTVNPGFQITYTGALNHVSYDINGIGTYDGNQTYEAGECVAFEGYIYSALSSVPMGSYPSPSITYPTPSGFWAKVYDTANIYDPLLALSTYGFMYPTHGYMATEVDPTFVIGGVTANTQPIRGFYGSIFGLNFGGGILLRGGGPISVSGTYITPSTLPTASLAPAFYLPAANAGTVLEAENKHGSTVSAGMVVTTHSSGTGFVLADATDIGKSVTGIARESIANTVSGEIQSEGLITLADWTAATGSSTLAAKANYFSDPANPGKLTTTAPTTTGHVSQLVGVAVSDDTMDLILSPPILL